MKTDDLIRAMAADTLPDRPVRQVLPVALFAPAALAGALFYATMGIRPDLADALARLEVVLKQALPPTLALAALGATLRLARPEARVGRWRAALLIAPVVAGVAFWLRASHTPLSDWPASIAGHSVGVCLLFIPLIGLPILAGVLWALRRGANPRPTLLGAAAGLLSGAAAATIYAFYCTDDSPMFWSVWYGLGILIVTGLGAAGGRRVLRW